MFNHQKEWLYIQLLTLPIILGLNLSPFFINVSIDLWIKSQILFADITFGMLIINIALLIGVGLLAKDRNPFLNTLNFLIGVTYLFVGLNFMGSAASSLLTLF